MKPWRLQADREVRGRRRSTPGVEPLEGRALLSTVTASATTKTEPAAYKPAPATNPKFPPYDITAFVTSPDDGGGSNQVFSGTVDIGGEAPAYSVIWLAVGTKPGYFLNVTQANILGQFALAVPVGSGTTTLQVFAENALQDYSNVEVLTVGRGDPIISWDATALHAIQAANLQAPEAARDLAVLHAAQYDAVAGLTDPDAAYQVHLAAPTGASAYAAADSAASTVLTALFPTQAATFATDEAAALSDLTKSPATTSGVNYGIQVADQTLTNRAIDGSNLTNTLAQFALVTPFEIASGSADRPAAPPSPNTTAYDQALAQVSTLGRFYGSSRTADQTAAALYWNEGAGAGSATDPAHWNAIAEQVTVGKKDSLLTDARVFAELDFALADAGIAASDSQSTYQESRPATVLEPTDPTFQPLVVTPSTPSYVSDDATYATAAAQVLTSTFGPNVKFTDTSESTASLTRSFPTFAAAATEDGNSRIWAGVNFSFDVQAGDALGAKVGQAVVAGFPQAK